MAWTEHTWIDLKLTPYMTHTILYTVNVSNIISCMRPKCYMYVKGNNTTEILGHVEVNSKSLPSCFSSARNLNWFKRGQRLHPHLQNGLSNTIVITWIRLNVCTSGCLAILNLWCCCYMEKIVNSQLPQSTVKKYKRHHSITKRIWYWEWEHL